MIFFVLEIIVIFTPKFHLIKNPIAFYDFS